MNRIKELRKKNRLTISELSKKLDIPQSSLTNYENEKRTPRTQEVWQKIADFFGEPVDYVMGLTEKSSFTEEYEDPYFLIENGLLWKEKILDIKKRLVMYTGLGKNDGKSITVKFHSNSIRWQTLLEIYEESINELEILYANDNISKDEYENSAYTYTTFPNINTDGFQIISFE